MKKLLILITIIPISFSLAIAFSTNTTDFSTTNSGKKSLVGNNPATWTPRYLSIKDFKKCLVSEHINGWSKYCIPSQQPKECPDNSWILLKKENIQTCLKHKT